MVSTFALTVAAVHKPLANFVQCESLIHTRFLAAVYLYTDRTISSPC